MKLLIHDDEIASLEFALGGSAVHNSNAKIKAVLDRIIQQRLRAGRDEQIRNITIVGDDYETDADAVVSEGDANGAYVMTWVWVPFAGTSLDKEAPPS